MTSKEQTQVLVAQRFLRSAFQLLSNEYGVHAESAIAGVARMAGTFMFRSFALPLSDVSPGQVVFSEQANEQGPALVSLMCGVLSGMEIELDTDTLGQTRDGEHDPLFDFLETQTLLEPAFETIRTENELTYEEAAEAGAIATAFLVHQVQDVLDPRTAADVAVFALIEGTKTAPDPVAH
ncbi:MAG: hypothetical protein KDA83_12505 [Planctomycetales bacterium]|nr:hypothetical protein [Planctomycetales bacterium]